ncbi:MAG: hypothetical protein A2Z90_02770 [Burkholderiales bacterium GWA2_64_37]|nr:MAG: hypothetical protein A2Z90_02770 [Burkholderiales bacterium GWA2_64_37]
MVAVAIVAVLAALAAPSFTPLIERWRVRSAAETLTSSLYYSRSEAIKRGGNVIIEKNPNSGNCTSASTNAEWGCGWKVFFDVNNNGIQDACNMGTTLNECDLQVIHTPTNVEIGLAASTGKISVDRWGMMSHTGSGTLTATAMAFDLMPKGKTLTDNSSVRLCVSTSGRLVRVQGTATCP